MLRRLAATAFFTLCRAALRCAVASQRKLQRIVGLMQKCSRKILFETLPEPSRRKRLSKRVLGLI